MAEKVLLIDGYSILNRAFYGLPHLSNSKGIPTNAVYGFINILLKVYDNEQPSYAAVAFDLKGKTFRHKMYDAYKGTRKPMPDELTKQVPMIRNILDSMGIKTVSCEGFEADDILGTLSRKCALSGMEVMILSGDKDILQLVTDKITQRLPKTAKGQTIIENYTPEKIMSVYGISPLQIIDLKAMMGDSSDNIPGLPGVGEKTAISLLHTYGTLENAHDHFEEIKPKKAMEAFRDHYDYGLMSKKLATIITDAPLDVDLEELKISNIFTDDAYSLFKEYEFKNLYPRFEKASVASSEIKLHFVQNQKEADEVLEKLKGCKDLGFEGNEDNGIFKGLALSNGTDIYYIDASLYENVACLKDRFMELIESVKCLSTYDLKEILPYIYIDESSDVFDIMIGAYLLNPLKSDYPYELSASEFGNCILPAAEEIVKGKITKSVVLTPKQRMEICSYKAAAAVMSAKNMKNKLREDGMLSLYENIELPLVYTLFFMESEGIKLNKDELTKFGKSLSLQIEKLENEIYSEAGEKFNINSPKQLGVILFEKMGLKGAKKTKSGYSTAADVLEKLSYESPIVEKILTYRQLSKLKSTYADSLANYCDDNGRIHSHFNQTVTATGRLSSTDPNLQNIPVRMELGREIRKVFVPKEGCILMDADYSQIELRVMAHLSGDKKLIKAYQNADDIHAITASRVFNVPIDEVTSLQRRRAKAVNFGIIYGISSFGLGKGLDISNKEAKTYIDKYFETYPGIKAFLDATVLEAKKNGYTTTLFGRRRPIPELSSSNFVQRSFGERAAMNSPIQGTAADIIKIAMNNVRRALTEGGFKAKLILQVHDELLLEVPFEEKEKVAGLLDYHMRNAADLLVPLDIDLKWGYNWDDAH